MAGTKASQDVVDRIHLGDCIAGMNKLPAGSVDLAFADPPFNIGYEYDVYDDARDANQYLAWSKEWIRGVHRVLKPDGTFWLAIGDEFAAELKLESQKIGFHCRSWVVWYYTFGVNCKAKFSRSHVHLFHFVKNPARFTFRSDELENRVPSARQLVYADARAASNGRLADDTWILRPQDLPHGFTPAEDTWYIPRVNGTFKERAGFHGCQMPEQLLGRIIRLCSHENELVLDPFSGSATTLTVAKKLGRHFIGFELSPEYADRGTQRLALARCGDLLEGAAEPTVSAPATAAGKIRRNKSDSSPPSAPPAKPAKQSPPVPAPAPPVDLPFETGLLQAYRQVYEGYSLDRVIADPDLNERLADECRRLGLLGEPRTWNEYLFRLRKAGRLVDAPTQQRTEYSWEACDPYCFASEIALSKLLAGGAGSLDRILCDPAQARAFDALAAQYAPGHTPLEYRWAALKLRKEANFARSRAERIRDTRPDSLGQSRPIANGDWGDLPAGSGVYVVSAHGDSHVLYVGGSFDLPTRLRSQFLGDLLEVWKRDAEHDDLSLRILPVEPQAPELFAYKCLLVGRFKPKLNFQELAA